MSFHKSRPNTIAQIQYLYDMLKHNGPVPLGRCCPIDDAVNLASEIFLSKTIFGKKPIDKSKYNLYAFADNVIVRDTCTGFLNPEIRQGDDGKISIIINVFNFQSINKIRYDITIQLIEALFIHKYGFSLEYWDDEIFMMEGEMYPDDTIGPDYRRKYRKFSRKNLVRLGIF